jgi:hypothetical protein
MFQFPGFACNPYEFKVTSLLLITIIPKPPAPFREAFALEMIVIEGGFPHSEIRGSKLVRSSPRLIAAYHVLHRLSAPRHPPDTLKTLDRSHYQCPPPAMPSAEHAAWASPRRPAGHCLQDQFASNISESAAVSRAHLFWDARQQGKPRWTFGYISS